MRRKLRHAVAGLITADDVDVAANDDDDDDDDGEGDQNVDSTTTNTSKTSSDGRPTAVVNKDKEDSELRMQLDSAEHEVPCYRQIIEI